MCVCIFHDEVTSVRARFRFHPANGAYRASDAAPDIIGLARVLHSSDAPGRVGPGKSSTASRCPMPLERPGPCRTPTARPTTIFMKGTISLLFCGVVISGVEEYPLCGVELADSNGLTQTFELLTSDLRAPFDAVATFCSTHA